MSATNEEQAAWDELDRLTEGSPSKLWRWSIPADPARDSDLILAAGLKAIAAERDAALAVIAEARALHTAPVRPKMFCTCGKIICDTQRALYKATK